MRGQEAYDWLIGNAGASDGYDAFDHHIIASVLALAIEEADDQGLSVVETCGLDAQPLCDLVADLFPACKGDFVTMCEGITRTIDLEEQSVRDILLMYASTGSMLECCLAGLVARRCNAPHHLWQDLGLRDRTELSALMARYFTRLSNRNSGDMKWKKFLYRMVCGSEGFSLCTTPVCSDCDDFHVCFGQESGESRLAHIRNGVVSNGAVT
ncbi:nitrogen fixation protein NifQ [Thalassospira sp. MA62]|nr:nitrogen fixation protein NifQ [Thalassospira sp. MA62]